VAHICTATGFLCGFIVLFHLSAKSRRCTIAQYDPLRGDPFFQLDLRLAKNFRIGEHVNLQLIAQAFNLTNRAKLRQ